MDSDNATSAASTQGRRSAMAWTLVIMSAFVVITAIVAVLAWVLTKSKRKSNVILKKERKLLNQEPLIVDESKVGVVRTGQPFALSLWMYLFDHQPTQEGKAIFIRQPNQNTLTGNPIIFLDSATNKLHVCVRTTTPLTTSVTNPATIQDIPNTPGRTPYVTVTVDYVPMQRWCNVVVVVQDYVLSVFLDGSIYAVENIYDASNTNATSRPMFAQSSGQAVIGKYSSQSATVHGFVSNVRFMQYAPTLNEVRKIYRSGPTDSWFSSFFTTWFRFSDE